MAFNKHEFLFFIRKKNLFFLGWGGNGPRGILVPQRLNSGSQQ